MKLAPAILAQGGKLEIDVVAFDKAVDQELAKQVCAAGIATKVQDEGLRRLQFADDRVDCGITLGKNRVAPFGRTWPTTIARWREVAWTEVSNVSVEHAMGAFGRDQAWFWHLVENIGKRHLERYFGAVQLLNAEAVCLDLSPARELGDRATASRGVGRGIHAVLGVADPRIDRLLIDRQDQVAASHTFDALGETIHHDAFLHLREVKRPSVSTQRDRRSADHTGMSIV